ncbi:hypothetical protein [Acetobacterium tundrae]|uniref:Uncharacterized protein n=1 Tax=Acetobacterium tundrae TaxID=132932 RepID=A0ABR6WJ95_9FIRM|nr:hypothetical protein [Acetobacterium tundrae]MBC3796414.1 hypothetical protein [Acetobacterium tundrae]
MNDDQRWKEKYYDVFQKYTRQKSSLIAIKAIVDAYDKQTITVNICTDDLDYVNHVYDLRTIMGTISNNTYGGLGLDIPNIWKGNKKKC